MELTISDRKDIREVFKGKDEIIKILLSTIDERIKNKELDNKYKEEISKIQAIGYENFSAEEVMECCEIDTLDYLYNEAEKRVNYARIYSILIGNGPDPYTINDDVGTLFDNNTESREELLKKDPDTIKMYERYGYSGFSPKEILKYKESNNVEELYRRAKQKDKFLNMYYEYIGEKKVK